MEKPRAGEKTTRERIHRLKSVLEGDPASVAFFPLSKVLYSAGAVDEAIQVLERGLSYHPEFVAARLDLAHIYHQIGRDDNAINQLEKAVSLDLYNVNALKDLAVILLEQGFKKEAVRYLSRLQDLDPENEQYQEWMEKATSETEPETVTVTAETPQPPTTSEFNTLTMVDIYIQQGLWKKAAEVLKAIITRNPNNREAQEKLAQINAEMENMQQGEPEEIKPSKTSWEAEETVPLASTGTREKDTAELLLDKWEEFRDLIATSGASDRKPEIEEHPVKPLITDEELERFAASIANITEEGLTPQLRSEEMDWEGIVTAEEKPSIRLESGYEAMAVDYSETQPSLDKPEPTTDASRLPRIEDFAPLEVIAPVELAETFAPIPVPIVEEGTRLEELTSPELLSSPDLVEMVAHAHIPIIVEAPIVEELPAPELLPTAELAEPPVLAPIAAVDESRLEELSTPEIIPTNELEELITPAPPPDAEELSALEELAAPELLPAAGLAEFAVPAPIPPIVEEPRLEDLTAPESFAAPALDDLTVSAPPPITESTFRLEDLTAPETMASPSLEALEEPIVPPPAPLEDIVPPEEALTLEGPPSLDDIVRPPDPPKTDKLESIDDLLGTTSTATLPAPPPPAQAPGEEEFPEFEDWLDRLKDQNA